MHDIVVISGSPFPKSRTDKVLTYMGEIIQESDLSVVHYSVVDVPAEDLISCNFASEEIKQLTKAVEQAKGIIIGSPVYKASYSGVLKALLDLLPQDAFAHKVVMPMMTGGTKSHLLTMEYVLKPLISILKGHPLKGVYFVEEEIDENSATRLIKDEITDVRLRKQLDYFARISRNDLSLYE